MKILTFILAIYILAINFTPCVDVNVDETISTEITQHQDHDHNSSDLCSPFCHCQCCQIFAINLILFDINLKSNEISNQQFLHVDNIGKEITFPILEPPIV